MSKGPHQQSAFAIARCLCADESDVEKIKASLYLRGFDPQIAARAIRQMRTEGHLPRVAPKELSPQERFVRNAEAGVMHLIDLKRAGHSPSRTELPIEPDGHMSAVCLRTRRLTVAASLAGSPAAACIEG